ncbi:MAG TPA: XdhC/CoxI family protein [Vicinamibacterales bacterium]|nr:XdhC/CoxI family protein [Vicinamibacterales bacterium]HPW21105.1 XdhC/CoxI family protein [Vicinamibacterales bacterium]
MHEEVLSAASGAIQRGEGAALVTVVSAHGSTPQRPGAKMLVHADGRTVGTIGGGATEHDAVGKAQTAIRTGRAELLHYDLDTGRAGGEGGLCGGRMDVFVDPLDTPPSLFVAGAGHVGQQLAALAATVGFAVHVVDDREAFANAGRFPSAASIAVADIASHLRSAPITSSAYVVVVTRGHADDLAAMRALAGREAKYIGMIGSKAKVAQIVDALALEGVAPDWLRRVRAPIGLRIGAVSPAEIAVSIVAELVAVRRGEATDASAAMSMSGR